MKNAEIDEEAFLNLDSRHLKEMGWLFDIFLVLYSHRREGGDGWYGSCVPLENQVQHPADYFVLHVFFIYKRNVHKLDEVPISQKLSIFLTLIIAF